MSHRIDWRRERRRILLPVVILRPYPVTDLSGFEATALIDTGSSVSGVAVSVAHGLGLVGLGKRPLKSAQGEGHVERYAFRIGLRSNRSATEILLPFIFEEVIGIELTNAFEFNALIGMDILSNVTLSAPAVATARSASANWLNGTEPEGSEGIQARNATRRSKFQELCQ